ncbi:MAG: hypothetical protein ACYTAS_15020 [Planctomycetota bacterium]|jgi:hypothetical protein
MQHRSFVAHPDPNIPTATEWTQWRIPFRKFTDINITSVKAMYIRVGDPDGSTSGGTGTIYIDDIRLAGEPPRETVTERE